MTLGILFTMFISWVIASVGISQFFVHMKEKRNVVLKLYWPSCLFSIFWLIMGLVWLLVGVTDFFAWNQRIEQAQLFALAFQFLIGIDLIIIWKYFLVRFFPFISHWAMLAPYVGIAMVFEAALFLYGFQARAPSFFASQLVLDVRSQIIFGLLFFPAFFSAVVDMFRILRSHVVTQEEKTFVLLASLSLIFLGIGGAVEQFGFVESSLVPSSRLLTLLGAIFAYLGTTYISSTRAPVTEIVI